MREEFGWKELVATVARIRDTLPAQDQPHVRIFADNYGEAGAIDLYGPAYGLPAAISPVNSFWLRGYGSTPPDPAIVVGRSWSSLQRLFTTCYLAGHNTNVAGVVNEESKDHPDIFVCRGPRTPWSYLWQRLQYFG